MTFTILRPSAELVTCRTWAKEWKKSHPSGPHRLNPPLEGRCIDPKPALVPVEVGGCTTCDGNGCEEGCGLSGGCESAYLGPSSHKVCGACHGSGESETLVKLRAALNEGIDAHTESAHGYVLGTPEREALVAAVLDVLTAELGS